MKQTTYNGRNVQTIEPTSRFVETNIHFRDVTVDAAAEKVDNQALLGQAPRVIQSIEMKDTGIIKARRILNGFQQIELNNMDNKIYLKNLTTNRDYEEEVKKKRLMRIAKGEDPDLEQEHIFINTDTGENNLLGLGGTEYKRAKIKDLYVNNIYRLTNPETEHIMVHHPIDINKMYINEIYSNNSDDIVRVSSNLTVNKMYINEIYSNNSDEVVKVSNNLTVKGLTTCSDTFINGFLKNEIAELQTITNNTSLTLESANNIQLDAVKNIQLYAQGNISLANIENRNSEIQINSFKLVVISSSEKVQIYGQEFNAHMDVKVKLQAPQVFIEDKFSEMNVLDEIRKLQQQIQDLKVTYGTQQVPGTVVQIQSKQNFKSYYIQDQTYLYVQTDTQGLQTITINNVVLYQQDLDQIIYQKSVNSIVQTGNILKVQPIKITDPIMPFIYYTYIGRVTIIPTAPPE